MHDLSKLLSSRASRRNTLKGGAALGLGAFATRGMGRQFAAAQDANSLEVFSW